MNHLLVGYVQSIWQAGSRIVSLLFSVHLHISCDYNDSNLSTVRMIVDML